ncbi:MAG: HTH-type transcriptional regulator BhcR [Pseudomonadota bacterium]
MGQGPKEERRRRGRPRTASLDEEEGTVQALDRGIRIMAALAKEGRATLSDLALRVGMPPSSAHRLLVTLQRSRMIEFHESTQEWLVGVEAFRIGNAFLQRNNLVEAGMAVMRRLVEETGETANIAIADHGDVVFLCQVETPNPIRAFFPPGSRTPMHASGIGKMLLAELEQRAVERILQDKGLAEFTPKTLASPKQLFEELERIRRRGWSLDDEERYSGMRCIAAPVYDVHGKAFAGISISGPTARLTDAAAPEMATKVRQAAAELTALTGGSPRAQGSS